MALKRILLFLLPLLWNCLPAPAQDTASYYRFELSDGTRLTGKFAGKHGTLWQILDWNSGRVLVDSVHIKKMEKVGTEIFLVVYLKDGGMAHGKLISQSENTIVLLSNHIGERSIPILKIREWKIAQEKDFKRNGKYWYPDFNATRYFLCPSAIPHRKNEGYFQTADLLINSAAYGISPSFSVQAGAVVPVGLIIMPKYSREIGKNLHAGLTALGAATLLKFRNTNYRIGAAMGLITLGDGNANISAGFGYGFSGTGVETIYPPKPTWMFGGALRFSRRLSLVTEHLVIPVRNSFYDAEGKQFTFPMRHVSTWGLRLLKEKTSYELGWITLPQEILEGFVWAGVTFRF